MLTVQEIAIMKCKKEDYLDFLTKLFMDNILHFLKLVCQKILCCDAETIMHRYNNVEVSQCVLFDREKQLEIVSFQGKQIFFL